MLERLNPRSWHFKPLPWAMCFIAGFFYMYEYWLRVTPSVLADYFASHYGLTLAQIGLISGAYYYAYTPMQLVVGSFIDRYGVRKLLTTAVIICAIGNLMFSNTEALIIVKCGRLLTGLGSSFAFVAVLKIAADWLPRRLFAFVSGITTTFGMLGAMGSEILLARWIKIVGTTQALHIFTVVAIILAIICWLFIHDTPSSKHTYHLEHKPLPLVEGLKHVLLNRRVWIIGFIAASAFMPLSLIADLWGIPFISKSQHVDSESAAKILSAIYIGYAIGSPIIGLIAQSFRRYFLMLAIGCFFSTALLLLFIFKSHLMSTSTMWWNLFFIGAASSVQILTFALARQAIRPDLTGTAVAVNNMIVSCTGLMQPLVGWLMNAIARKQVNINNLSVHDFQLSMLMVPIFLALATIVAMIMVYKKMRISQ